MTKLWNETIFSSKTLQRCWFKRGTRKDGVQKGDSRLYSRHQCEYSSTMRMNHVKQKCIYKDCDEGSFHFLTLAISPQGRLWDKSWPSSWKPGNTTCGLLLLPIIGLLPFNPVIHDGSYILNRSCWCNIIMWQNVFNWSTLSSDIVYHEDSFECY